jgi:hypothetical protein
MFPYIYRYIFSHPLYFLKLTSGYSGEVDKSLTPNQSTWRTLRSG